MQFVERLKRVGPRVILGTVVCPQLGGARYQIPTAAAFPGGATQPRIIGARLEQLRSRLHKLADLDLSKVPADRVGLGSVVTVVDMDTKEEEVFEVVIPDAVNVEEGHISVSSPLGQALLDKKVKNVAKVQLPFGTRRLRIKKLVTMHDQGEAG